VYTSLGIEWRIDTEVDCKYGFPCINGEVVGTIVGSVAESLREACKERIVEYTMEFTA